LPRRAHQPSLIFIIRWVSAPLEMLFSNLLIYCIYIFIYFLLLLYNLCVTSLALAVVYLNSRPDWSHFCHLCGVLKKIQLLSSIM
jgi:hypothetical protein